MTSCQPTNPFAIVAREYSVIDPNRICRRPILSPMMPKRIPPSSIPVICQLRMLAPTSMRASRGTPSAVRLGIRTMLKRMRS